MESLFGSPVPISQGNSGDLFDGTDRVPLSPSPLGSIAVQVQWPTFDLSHKDEDDHSSAASDSSSIPTQIASNTFSHSPVLQHAHTSPDISGPNEVSEQDLVSTDVLMRFGIFFYRTFRLLICMLCHVGHSLSSIHTHLK